MARKLPPFYARLRFATAFISTWLLNLNVFGFSLKSVCSPGLNCHGCPWATTACPIGALTYGSAMHSIPVLALGSVLAVGVVLGRLVCGFMCPFGFLQDLLHKLPGPKISLPWWFRYGKYVTLALLVFILPWFLGFDQAGYLQISKPKVDKAAMAGQLSVVVTATNVGMEPLHGVQLVSHYRDVADKKESYQQADDFEDVTIEPGQTVALPAYLLPNNLATAELTVDSPQCEIQQTPRYQLYFCKLCPSGTLTATLPLYFSHGENGKSIYAWAAGIWVRLGIMVAFLVVMVIGSRPFCRLFCPLGAMYAITARLSVVSMKVETESCVECGLCDKACPLELDVRKEIGGMECIACGDCKKVCPESGIHRTFGI